MRVRASLAVAVTVGAALVLAACSSSRHDTATAATTVIPATATSGGEPPSTAVAVTTRRSGPATGPAGGPVPAAFGANSATFISDTEGWVLGSAPCPQGRCTSVLRTTDRGATWIGIPAPRDALVDARDASSTTAGGIAEIRFVDTVGGWAFDPDLWSTHDGGTHWTKVQVGAAGDQVEALAAAGGRAYVVAGPRCAQQPSTSCRATLYVAPSGSDAFSQVPGVSVPGVPFDGGLALHGDSGYLLGNPTGPSPDALGPSPMYAVTDGTRWAAIPDRYFDLASVTPRDADVHTPHTAARRGMALVRGRGSRRRVGRLGRRQQHPDLEDLVRGSGGNSGRSRG